MQTRRDFVGQLVRFRKARGMTQMQLAKAAGISQQQISNIETGQANPRLDTVIALLMGLGGSLTIVPNRQGPATGGRVDASGSNLTWNSGDNQSPPASDAGPKPRSRVSGLIVPDEDDDAG